MRVRSAILMLMAVMLACTTGSVEPLTLNGDFDTQVTGDEDGQAFNASGVFSLTTLSTGLVTGTWSLDDGSSGNLNGQISGSTFDFELMQTAPCITSFFGNATADSSSFNGTYSGTGCAGDVNGVLTATAN